MKDICYSILFAKYAHHTVAYNYPHCCYSYNGDNYFKKI